MENFLRPTSFLDCRHPAIRKLAADLDGRTDDPRRKVAEVFYFVRDRIYYSPYVPFEQPEDYRASRVLERGQGFCIPKAALAATLFRCLGFPCKLYFADIINHKAPEKFKKLMNNLFIHHCYVGVFLEGEWLKLAPTFNREIFTAIRVAANDFDGRGHALLPATDLDGNPFVEYVKDHGERDDIPYEEIMESFNQVYGPEILTGWCRMRSENRKQPQTRLQTQANIPE